MKKWTTETQAMVKDLQALIQIKSVEGKAEAGMPFGPGPKAALDAALALCDRLGFRTKDLDGYAGFAEFGQGEEVVGILAHLDVVPEGDSWDFPPYEAHIADGKIFGRGTIDDKGPAVAALYGMKRVMDSGVALKRRVRMIFGTNEETGWGGIHHYVEKEGGVTLGFTPDGAFPLIHGEKGILDAEFSQIFPQAEAAVKLLSLAGGNAVNMVPDSATAILGGEGIEDWIQSIQGEILKDGRFELIRQGMTCSLKRIGKSAHGSTPEAGENAVSHLIDFLVNHGVQDPCLDSYMDLVGLEMDGASFGCKMDDEYGALTFNVGLFEYKNGEANFRVNIRYPISKEEDAVWESMQSIASVKKGWLADKLSHLAPIYREIQDPLVQTLLGVYREVTGDLENQPFTIGGGTYARAMDNVVAFGPGLMGSSHLAHQPNEYIEVEELIALAEIYEKAIVQLAK
ncbi:dipeptidase PepV [Gottschalkiaceae bacterium SANA]|nr:dipeptidase PepV [Gottschalkiaceae bacterium SANA]